MGDKNEQCLYRNEEARGKVPGTTCKKERTNSAINNNQAPGYLRTPEGMAQCLGLQRHQAEAHAIQWWRHTSPLFIVPFSKFGGGSRHYQTQQYQRYSYIVL